MPNGLQDYDDAIRIVDRYLRENPNNHHALRGVRHRLEEAQNAYLRGRYQDAERILSEILEPFPIVEGVPYERVRILRDDARERGGRDRGNPPRERNGHER